MHGLMDYYEQLANKVVCVYLANAIYTNVTKDWSRSIDNEYHGIHPEIHQPTKGP
jgi:hypothetical protein